MKRHLLIGAILLLLLCHNQTPANAERGTGRDKLLYATEQAEDPKRGDWRRE